MGGLLLQALAKHLRRQGALWLIATLATVTCCFRLVWIWRGWLDGELTLADDAFYYFQIARNVAMGLGPTFDGLAPTNGFHPLYLVLLGPLYDIWPQSPWVPIHAALTFLMLCDVGSAALLYFMLARRRPLAGIIAAGTWLLHPLVIATSHRGLESSLSTMLLLAALVAYDRWRLEPRKAIRAALTGLACGLVVLARTDNGLLVIGVKPFVSWKSPRLIG